ncbi:FimV/HubP family polar landmark protein [Iodobacter sp. LRB]|uniref:FimV/HubP family polar landmark protein n=1 Tax=Iodobacter sp. BJB302 TaxID=1506510 RepID=UPI00117A5E58|nr:FimV/HubP family polar landmark protein [Iodobacter sp. BJB302]
MTLPPSAGAVGLGRLNVLSGLGQPFRAEIDLVSVQPGESESLLVRLASPEAFAQAQVAYPPASLGLRLVIEKRANGQQYVLISSAQSVSEPFLDLLVDLNWSGGKIQRDYTALIDPPGYQNSRSSAGAEAKANEQFAPSALPGTRRKGAVAGSGKKTSSAASQAEKATGDQQYKVQGGDTLSSVARQTAAEGVTLEQMLVGLYRQNPDAFDGNMNRLRRGKILNIPAKENLQAVPAKEAGQEVRLQSKDWQAYRNKVAESVQKRAAVAGNESASAGRISPKVEEKVKSGNANQDVLKLSKGEAPSKAKADQQGEQARIRALEEEVTARQKGLDEANQRVAALQKNVQDMEKLLALKSRAGVELASKPTDTPAVAPVATAVPAVASAPAAEHASEPEPAAVAGSAPAVQSVQEVASQPKKRRVIVPPPVPVPEPDLMDVVADNALPIGGGLTALLLGGAGLWWARRRKQGSAFADSVLTGGDLKSNTLLGNTGGAVISTQPTENSFLTDFSRQGLGTIDTDEVDPIAEAEVYMAYDRNEQAEEILRDALLKDPARHEIRMKLLEIFAAKKDPTSYEEIAADLFAMTGGKGAQWEQAAYQGSVLDPENPLYKRIEPAAAPVVAAVAAAAAAPLVSQAPAPEANDFDLSFDDTAVTAPSAGVSDFDALMSEEIPDAPQNNIQNDLADLDLSLDFDVGTAPEPVQELNPFAETPPSQPEALSSLDFDLPEVAPAPAASAPAPDDFAMGIDFGLDDFLVPEEPAQAAAPVSEPESENMLSLDMPVDFGSALEASAPADEAFDLNFDGLDNMPEAAAAPADFSAELPDLDLGVLSAPEVPAAPPAKAQPVAEDVLEATSADDGLGLDFDFSLDTPLEASVPAASGAEESIDLAGMNLDFAADSGASSDSLLEFAGDDPVQTKIDLAKAYVDMGDTEGAREILQEAIGEGNPEQQKQAQALLGNL